MFKHSSQQKQSRLKAEVKQKYYGSLASKMNDLIILQTNNFHKN